MKAWPLLGVVVVQCLLFFAHTFLFHTWIAFFPALDPTARHLLHGAILVLALSFGPVTLLAFSLTNPVTDFLYAVASTWLGFFNFLFFAACFSWLFWYALLIAVSPTTALALRPWICGSLTSLALAAGIYGMVNAQRVRIHRVSIRLPNLPASWQGRSALVMSDLHLGPINGARFARRIAAMATALQPHIVFLPGDLFDGTKAHLDRMLAPFQILQPPLGIFFSTGNHEEFGAPTPYFEAITRAGIRVLANERVTVDGLHIAGISYGLTHSPVHLRSTLDSLRISPGEVGILLNHVPTRLPLAEAAGFSLQLSGHTHRGQIFPFTWITRRIFGAFTYGLQVFGALQVYTSSGAGTWGPPMRVGSPPEIVLLTFV